MASQQMDEIKAMLRQRRDESAGAPEPTIEEARAGMEAMLGAFPPVEGVRNETVDAGGVPAEWTYPGPDGDPATPGTLLYLHGGGYTVGSPSTHRRLVSSLCLAGGVKGLSVDYRLAPEHPFPAALDDALAAYRWLTGPAGVPASQVVVAGDSAGGGLAAALLVSLRDAGDPQPAGGYLISPWTDLAATGASRTTRASVEPMLEVGGEAKSARMYTQSGDLDDPLVSPLYADLAGLAPLFVQVGDHEILLDDSTRLVDAAKNAGVDVELTVWPEAFHVFQILVGVIPEADEAVSAAGKWIAERVAAAG